MVVSLLGLSIDTIAAYCGVLPFVAGEIVGSKKLADRRGITPNVARWMKTNWTYCRYGFRWYAFLAADLTTNRATAIISKYPVLFHGSAVKYSGVTYDSGIRVEEARSSRFQRRKSLAWQIHRTWVPYCASNGWNTLYISAEGYLPWVVNGAAIHHQTWVSLESVWSPVRPLPKENVRNFWGGPDHIPVYQPGGWGEVHQ